MAVNPPLDPALIPPGMGVAGATKDGLLVIARNLVMPWADLNAADVPEDYLRLAPELIATVSALTAMGPVGPRLLQTDALARLLTVGVPNAVDMAQASALINGNLVTVGSISAFAPGSWLMIIPQAGNTNPGTQQFYQVVGQVPPNQLKVAPALQVAVNPGDFVVGVPMIWIAGQTLQVQIPAGVSVNGNVPVLNATGTRIAANLEQTKLQQAAASGANPNPNTTRITVPSNIVALVLMLINQAPSHFQRILAVANQVSGVTYCDYHSVTQPLVYFPFLGAEDPSVDITLQSDNGNQVGVQVIGLTAPDLGYEQFFIPPWITPNQPPVGFNTTIAANGNLALIAENANVALRLFNGAFAVAFAQGLLGLYAGVAATPRQTFLGGIAPGPVGPAGSSGSVMYPFDFKGAALPVGKGLYLAELAGFATEVFGYLGYSTS